MINKKQIKEFLEKHRDMDISPAKMEYTLYLVPQIEEYAAEIAPKKETLEEMLFRSEIEATEEPEKLVSLMRKYQCRKNTVLLREKLLAKEDSVFQLIQEKCITNMQDIFIENALRFFLYCEQNPTCWFLENYGAFRSGYLKSMFCLIVGFRGEVDSVPFLISEAERFERMYPKESYDQGPMLAVSELLKRFKKEIK